MLKRNDFWFDAEGDFQDLSNYERLFADLLEKAQVAGAVVAAEQLDDDGDEHGFAINVRVSGRVLTFKSENEPEEWADVPFVVKMANELGTALGFAVTEIETGDQCVALRITRLGA
jgi:hypothetical protein